MVPKPASGTLPTAADRILQDLADYGWKSNIAGMVAPIEHIEDDLQAALSTRTHFAFVSHELDGAFHRIVLSWDPKGSHASLRTDVHSLLSELVHATTFIDERMRDGGVTYSVVTGRSADRKEPGTHVLQVKVVGPGVEVLVAWTRKHWPDQMDRRL